MKITSLFFYFFLLSVKLVYGQSCELLYLPFNGSPYGIDGEIPIYSGEVLYEAGVKADGGKIAPGDCFLFDKENNINEKSGTLEFWLNTHNEFIPMEGEYFLRYGGAGGMLAFKDGTNSMRLIFSQYSTPYPELDVSYSMGWWDMYAWHYIVYTWDEDEVYLYMDGQLVDSDQYCINMPPVTCFTFPTITADYLLIGPTRASLDELVIHDCPKDAAYVTQRYQDGLLSVTNSQRKDESSFSIFPTIADEKIYLKSASLKNQNLTITFQDLSGVVKKEMEIFHSNERSELTITDLPAGVYFVSAETKNTKSPVMRIIVQ